MVSVEAIFTSSSRSRITVDADHDVDVGVRSDFARSDEGVVEAPDRRGTPVRT